MSNLVRLLELDPRQPLEGPLLKLHAKEQGRLRQLWLEEHAVWQERPGAVIVGADEVGRGPLAGPLVAAAATFTEPLMQLGLNDSKKLSPAEREAIFERLSQSKLHFAVAVISHEEISCGNLHLLTLQALEMAVRSLQVSPHLVLIDGRHSLKCQDWTQRTVIGGDRLCASIAAASIMAKVTRDRMMLELDLQYPGYNFAKNKGYGTADHIQALRKLGPCPIHRRNFAPVQAHFHEQLQLFKKPRAKKPKP